MNLPFWLTERIGQYCNSIDSTTLLEMLLQFLWCASIVHLEGGITNFEAPFRNPVPGPNAACLQGMARKYASNFLCARLSSYITIISWVLTSWLLP